jgi:hypothetical protein
MSITTVIFAIIGCAIASVLIYGIWLIETDNDEFRKKHGYKPKYHYLRKEENEKN